MGQPKKLTHLQRQERKLDAELALYRNDLIKIKRSLKQTTTNLDTWRWASLETYREISNKFDINNPKVKYLLEISLNLAKEAQLGMGFGG